MDIAVSEYRKRRADRLKGRDKAYRSDAPGDDEEQGGNNGNNNRGGEGSHGNTRLPFGLCKRFGIEIGADWTPKDAWAALKGEGITPEGAFSRLERGEDPGVPDSTDVAGAETAAGGGTIDMSRMSEGVTSKLTSTSEVLSGVGVELESGDKFKLSGVYKDGDNYVVVGKDADGKEYGLYEMPKESLDAFLSAAGVMEPVEDMLTGDPVYSGEPAEPVPHEPKKTLTIERWGDTEEYGDLKGEKEPWRTRGDKWTLSMTEYYGGEKSWYRRYEHFRTVDDMLHWLGEKGVEEFVRPDTGETVNPAEMEFPDMIGIVTRSGDDTGIGIKGISIGLRGGRYTVLADDMDGKGMKLGDFPTLSDAKLYISGHVAVDPDKIKLSPSLRKREEARLAWTKSDKKEWLDKNGVRYGDLHLRKSGLEYEVFGDSVDGDREYWSFETKAEALKFLKEQGIESVVYRAPSGRVSYKDEVVDVKNYEVPEAVATIGKVPVKELWISNSWSRGEYSLMGTDLDGEERIFGEYQMELGDGVDDVKAHFARKYNISDPDVFDVSDETRKLMKETADRLEEKDRRKREFEKNAVMVGLAKCTDPHVESAGSIFGDGVYQVFGYDENGNRISVMHAGDFYDLDRDADKYGINIRDYIKDDAVLEKYDKYRKGREEFDKKSVLINGERYADLKISLDDGGNFLLEGKDARGRGRNITRGYGWAAFEGELAKSGVAASSLDISDKAKKVVDKARREQTAIASGEYSSVGMARGAWTDIEIRRGAGESSWDVLGKDVDGKMEKITSFNDWDSAVRHMSENKVGKYKVVDRGKEMGMPRDGMRKVSILKAPDGSFHVYADVGEEMHKNVFNTSSEEEARKWVRDCNIPDGSVITAGMNPNDDVVRTYKAKSLDNFDNHRVEKAADYPVLTSMNDETKVEAVDMLTEMFDKGAYRMWRDGHFEEIVNEGFKNQLETGTSGGYLSGSRRRGIGERVFGHSREIAAEDAEKYGFYGVEDDGEAYTDDTASWYGKVLYKFKKDKVGEKTTYTFGDTLDNDAQRDGSIAGYAGKKPTFEGISGLSNYGFGEVMSAYRKYKDGEIGFRQFYDTVNSMCQNGYVEAQFHGPLTIEDVDTITFGVNEFTRTFSGMPKEKRDPLLTKLKNNGILLQYYDFKEKKIMDGYDWIERYERGEVTV